MQKPSLTGNYTARSTGSLPVHLFPIPGVELFRVGQQLLFVYSKPVDMEVGADELIPVSNYAQIYNQRFTKFCGAILEGMNKDITKVTLSSTLNNIVPKHINTY
jgi:hypothetical protein